ncbi:MAG TPA: magnesium transporter [Niabella sp.]|nr:magnesium transporter [Niabella sp.]HRC22030.1 magnesium transporter [Niabella sp.]
MQMEEDKTSLTEQFEAVVSGTNWADLKAFLDDQNISDVVELVYEFPEYEVQVIANMSVHRAVNVFKLLDIGEQKRIIQELSPSHTAALLNELPADDRTDFLEELPDNVVRELIKLLDPEERRITLSLLGYPENSIGRLMNPDYVYVYPYNTVSEVFATIKKYGKNSDAINVIYVINETGELLDDIRIGEFLLSEREVKVSELMDERVIALKAFDDQETAAEAFRMNNRVALPVVTDSNKLLGIVTIDDVLWVASEEFSEDMQKMGGTEAFEEPYLDISIFKLYKKRIGWLTILFISEMLTATAMQHFEVEIEKATLLALFVPLIMSSGGNSGSQASTIIIQALTLGEITLKDWWYVMRREIISGLMLGLTLGTIGFLRIILWQNLHLYDYGDHFVLVALTIFFTLIGIVLWGSLIGSMLPILLKKCKLDPATSSAPFVATLVDVTGIIIYFSVAYLVLKGTLL